MTTLDKNVLSSIDITKKLALENFCLLFEQVTLNDEERDKVKVFYWNLYTIFIQNNVNELDAFSAVKNVFISQETQIKDRL